MATAPGKSHRKGLTVKELMQMFPTEDAARLWFEKHMWPNGPVCPHCGSTEHRENPASESRPYRCKNCGRHFSVRVGTILERSKVSLQDWAIAIYMHLTSLKGVSSMKLHRDLGVTQKTAWFMLQRIRKAFDNDDEPPFGGPAEADETWFGGLRKNMSKDKRKGLSGRGAVGKDAVVGVKDRATGRVAARHVRHADTPHVAGFVAERVKLGAKLYTDEARAYRPLAAWYNHEAVNHSVGEYVRGMAHTNGIESFWAMLKRAHKGTYHKISPKHLHRYVAEFAGKHNVREADTVAQMAGLATGMVGKRLMYRDLIADNGLASGARS
ncbi:MAG: IS1595 family transposase [Rhodospirillaceae bacterium]|nr:IS1595 family transposase [Rhodospirillaceae bacterium]MDE0616452.1 IS1595 family transposase [Rhodospirillaceae bacterium]